MHTYDKLFAWFALWVVLILGYFFASQFFAPEFHLSNEFTILGLILLFLGFITLFIYFLALKRQRKQIYTSLKTLQESGMQIFIKKYERLIYGRDLGDLPKILQFFFNFNCLAVFQPKNVIELKSIVALCEHYKIPLIPRGAATSGYGGTLPIKNGIIVNLTYFDKVIALDEEKRTVEVESGATWEHLRRFLESKGFTLYSYPSSAPSSTIGGWVTQGGYGIGSSKFGGIDQSVESITVIGTEGKEFHFDNPKNFVGSCGSLGILWKLNIRIKAISRMVHLAVSSAQQDQLVKSILAYQGLDPFFLRYDDSQNLIWKEFNTSESSWNSQYYTGGIISMSFLEEDWDQEKFDEITNKFQLSLLSNNLGEKFWNDRFYTIRFKRRGPSLIVAELLIPNIHLENAVKMISKCFRRDSYVIEILSTSEESVLFVWFPADFRRKSIPIIGSLSYTFYWLRFFYILQITRRWKGKPYSSGLWFSPYSSLILKEQLKQMKKLKKKVDPLRIFNPGKVWGTRIPRFFPIIPWAFPIRLSTPLIGLFFRLLPKRLR